MKKQEGITLVALVITIIVLLILAMVSIKIVMDGGLITRASKATDTHTIEAEKEAITTGYAAYQMALANKENVTQPKIEGEPKVTSKGEGWSVTFTKTNNEYELKKDGTITLTKQGNGSTTTVGWTDNGDDTFTKGDVTVKVGDKVNYDEGKDYSTIVTAIKSGHTDNQTFKTENLGWRVLGINTKGELELISDNSTNSSVYLKGEKGYLNAEEVLNNMCNELYGKGKHATGARSLNVDDINKLANYDPTTYDGYGDIYTYRFPTSGDYMQYKITNKEGTIIQDWKNIKEQSWQNLRAPGETETISANNRNDTGRKLESNYYHYDISEEIRQKTSDGKKMSDIILKGTGTNNKKQWLASRCIKHESWMTIFYVCYVVPYEPEYNGIYSYNGGEATGYYYVRPVVTLKSDIQLSGNSNDGWTIN